MPSVSDALRRFGGMYGSAWRNGVMLAEAIEVSGTVTVNRVEVPLVGQTKTGYKPGRETREGTMRIQVIDSTWALEIYQYLNQSLETRQQNRGTAAATLRTFDLTVQVNDPEAYDMEKWQLENCQIWHLPIGFTITDDIVQREIPITWEAETPLHVFTVDRTSGAVVDRTLSQINGFPGGV